MKIKVFGLTHAGGSADFYKDIKDKMADYGLEMISLEYAGHGSRYKEAMYYDFEQLAEDMSSRIIQSKSEDDLFVLMGYSMGSIAVIEILYYMRKNNYRMPDAVIIAAHEPQRREEFANWSDESSDEILKERINRFGGIPSHLIENKVFWRVYLPIFKRDFRLIAGYHFNDMGVFNDIPALILYSEEDTPLVKMRKWESVFVDGISLQRYSGNHFFLNNHVAEIAEKISLWLKEAII